jgi:hypothetical protein
VDGSSLATSPCGVRLVHRVMDRRVEENWVSDARDPYGFVEGGAAVVLGVVVPNGRRLTLRT